jgi:alanine racemase
MAYRDAWVEVDLGAVVANARALADRLGGSACIAPVVKANAYGHGAVPVSRVLAEAGFGPFCVATVDEGIQLREAGLGGRIIVLYEPPLRALADATEAGLDVTLCDTEAVETVAQRPVAELERLRVQLKIDTGMTRQGLRLADLEALRSPLRSLANCVSGIWTHFADGADRDLTDAQLARFDDAVAMLRKFGVEAPRHVAGSAAVLAGLGQRYEFARPGLSLYGAVPTEFSDHLGSTTVELRPVMAVRARSIRIADVPRGTAVGYGGTFVTERASRLTTLPLGYADGLRRSLGNGRGCALIAGRRAPIVGRVSMDSCVVDVTDIGGVDRATVFTLVGSDGADAITLEEISQRAGTIPQEMAVGFDSRLPYVYAWPGGDSVPGAGREARSSGGPGTG